MKKLLLTMLIGSSLTGCIVDREGDWLAFLEPGKTTMEELEFHLGKCDVIIDLDDEITCVHEYELVHDAYYFSNGVFYYRERMIEENGEWIPQPQ